MRGPFYPTPPPYRPTGNILSISSPRNSRPNGWRNSQELIAIPFVIVLSLLKAITAFCGKKLEPRRVRRSPPPLGTGGRKRRRGGENVIGAVGIRGTKIEGGEGGVTRRGVAH